MAGKETAQLEERLSGLTKTMESGFSHIEALIAELDKRLRTMEMGALTDLATLKTRMDAAFRRIDDHQDILGDMPKAEDLCKMLEQFPGVLNLVLLVKWLLGAIGVLVIALIFGILTGQVSVSFGP